jgi:type IV secretory pathway VirB2 component (pilin)
VTGTAEILLGVIALAVAIMAIVQVGAIIAGLRLARRVEQLATDLEAGVKPLIADLTAVTADASKAVSLAGAQVERFDRVVADLTARADQTLTAAQQFVTGPAREGMAIVAGIRAALSALQTLREASRRRTAVRSVALEEDEESLFIG